VIKDEGMGGTHSMGSSELYTKFQSQNLKGRNSLEDLGIDGRMVLK
jgi:hypothetical protein